MVECPKRLNTLFFFILSIILASAAGNSYAQDSKTSRTQSETEITVIHVDKYGIYGPNVIFYWDPSMGKQKLDALMKAAERLRNKKIVVAYSAAGDLKTDKRPLVVDLPTRREESDYASSTAAAREEPSKIVPHEEKTAKVIEDGAKPAEKNEAKSMPPKEEPVQTSKEAAFDDLRLKEYSQKRLYNEEKPLLPPNKEDLFPKDKQTAAIKEPQPLKPPVKSVEPKLEFTEPGSMTREELSGMIRRILKLNEMKDLDSIMSFYADQVNYYERGLVNKDYIRKDMGYYFRNWDRINTSLDGDVVLIVTDQHDMRIVKYYSVYYVENSKKAVRGRTENIWKIQKINNGLKIVDIKQRIVSNE